MSLRLPVHTRWLIQRDMPEVLAIEHASFALPWSEDDFKRVLQKNCGIALVAVVEQRVLGFMVYEFHRSHFVVLNIAVRPDVRRREIGTQLVEKLSQKLTRESRRRIECRVPETNLAAQKFFAAAGLRATRVVAGDPNEFGDDSYEFTYTIPAPALEAC